jgi:S1-C subfamily serine protease
MSETRFSGKQVLGIVVLVLVILGLGLVGGGWIGYRLGRSEGTQAAASVAPQALDQQQAMPFRQVLPNMMQAAGGPYLGVEFQTITPEVAASEAITGTTGALIRSVVADGPAAKAGLKAGDVVTAVNGQAVDEQNDLRSRVAEFKAGDEITLTIVKGTANGPIDQRDVKVTLGERPATQPFNWQLPFGNDGQAAPATPDAQPTAGGPYLGVEFEIITPEVAASEAITGTTGALIRAVMAGSPAAAAGVKKGDVVLAVNGKSVDEQNDLRALVQNYKVGDAITLTIVTGTAHGPTDQRDVKVTLAARPTGRQFQMPSDNASPGRTD